MVFWMTGSLIALICRRPCYLLLPSLSLFYYIPHRRPVHLRLLAVGMPRVQRPLPLT